MRFHRIIVPLVAAVILAGVLLAVRIAVGPRVTGSGASSQSGGDGGTTSPQVAELQAIKNEAEALAIADKLPEAHAKYRELFARARGIDVKDPAFWDLLERAKIDQDRIYVILLSQHDPNRILTPPLPTTTAAAGTTAAGTPAAAARPATTQSFVDTHPPYQGVTPGSSSATTTASATAPAATNAAAIPAELPEPKRLTIRQTPRDPSGFSDVRIGQSLAAANDFLVAQFKDGEVQQGKDLSESYRQGLNALVIYALLHSGEATHDSRLAPTDEFMRQAIERLKSYPLSTDTSKAQQPLVYARALRAAVLAEGKRGEDREILKDDVQWLIAANVDGAYSYDDRFTVRVIPADPHTAGSGQRKAIEPPAGVQPPEAKPKTLGPTKLEQPAAPPAQGSNGNGPKGRAMAFPAGDGFALEAPLPIQLADGMHDPRTGRELGPPRRLPPPSMPPGSPPRYPPPMAPPMYPPQGLPEKYGGSFVWDNSNSQYGLLGVWAGAEAGIEVPDAYWASAEKHWLGSQLAKGEWSYRQDTPGGRLAMTCAGLASLYVTHDYLEAPSVARIGRQPSPATGAMRLAFGWLEKGDNAVDVTGPRTVYLGYTLHTLSRVGLASGYKYFGAHDWYRTLARKVVQSQWDNGSWGRSDRPTADTLIDTAYSVLFLARGRHPILMNKLRLDGGGVTDRGEWNNRPRDLPNLARFASRELERPLNWQVVSIDRDPADWSDAPILYLASHAALKLSDAEIAKIRAFTDAGGMLFTQADDGSDSFNLYVNQLAKKLFPDFQLAELSADDPIYTLQYVIAKPNRPRLRGLSNGSRLVWVHSPADLAVHWQQRAEKTQRTAFEMGVNLFVYAAGKTDLRNRIADRAIPAPAAAPSISVKLARLKYAGTWDPEPAAWPRFARYLQWETSIAIDPQAVDIASLANPKDTPIAHLSGRAAYSPSDAELARLRDYVSAGGVLIVEAMGSADSGFADSLQGTILTKAFAGAKFEALPADGPMLHATFRGMEDVSPPRLRMYAVQKLGKDIPPIRQATVGKGRVIYLPLDATSGLLGADTWPIFGYEPGEAQALMKNIILWNLENPPSPG